MTLSEQIDALQAKVSDPKSSLDASRHETNEQIKARVASAEAKAKAAEETVHGSAGQSGIGKTALRGWGSGRPAAWKA